MKKPSDLIIYFSAASLLVVCGMFYYTSWANPRIHAPELVRIHWQGLWGLMMFYGLMVHAQSFFIACKQMWIEPSKSIGDIAARYLAQYVIRAGLISIPFALILLGLAKYPNTWIETTIIVGTYILNIWLVVLSLASIIRLGFSKERSD